MQQIRKRAVVLGASRPGGTGWVTAETLAGMGMTVVVAARRLEAAAELARTIGGQAQRCDATIEADVEAFSAAAAEPPGSDIDIAVLAAGEGVAGSIDSLPEADLQRAIALNFTSGVYFIRHMARRMRAGGSVILVSSIAATNPWPGYFAYGCAKAALQMLVKYAGLEYAARGIRVNAVCPGPIEAVPGGRQLGPALEQTFNRAMPLGRRVTPREVADAVAWLATSATSTTGDMIHLDGGMHLGRPPFPDEIAAAAASDRAGDPKRS